MTDYHAILKKAWEDGDAIALGVLADKFDEDGVPDAGALIRLQTDELREAAHPTRAAELQITMQAVRDHLLQRDWDSTFEDSCYLSADMPLKFLVRSTSNCQQVLVLWAGKMIYDLRFQHLGSDSILTTSTGLELRRQRLSHDDPWRHNPIYYFKFGEEGFTLYDVVESLGSDWSTIPVAASTVEEAIRPAAIAIEDLPIELLPVVAGHLAAHLHAPWRRVLRGEKVLGAHLFEYERGRWVYRRTLARSECGRPAVAMVAAPVQDDDDDGRGPRVRPRLLVQVGKGIYPRPTHLSWGRGRAYGCRFCERSALKLKHFELAAEQLRLSLRQFAVDTQAKAKALFSSRRPKSPSN